MRGGCEGREGWRERAEEGRREVRAVGVVRVVRVGVCQGGRSGKIPSRDEAFRRRDAIIDSRKGCKDAIPADRPCAREEVGVSDCNSAAMSELSAMEVVRVGRAGSVGVGGAGGESGR